MSDRDLLVEALDRLLDDHAVEATAPTMFDARLWAVLDDAGFTRIGVPESAGGSGGSMEDAFVVLDRIGAAAADVPVAETVVAGTLCAAAGLTLPAGVATCAVARSSDDAALSGWGRDGGGRVTGVFRRVPWAASADVVVVAVQHDDGVAVAVVPADRARVTEGWNVAGERRDTVELDDVALGADEVAVVAGLHTDDALLWAAAARAVLTAGAVRRILELTRDHVTTRVQFGKPLASFPVVRNTVAEMAGEVAAASVAAETAFTHEGQLAFLEVAAARVRTARAAGTVATAAHQLHGAIGFTDEHVLHRSTRRAWAWRDEPGTQGWWEQRLGEAVAAAGADQLWPGVVGE